MRTSKSALMAAALLLATTAGANARPDARTLTCDEARSLIQGRHAVVLTTGPNTYERYVRAFGNECDWPEVPLPAFVATKDGPCLVHRCEEPVFAYPGS